MCRYLFNWYVVFLKLFIVILILLPQTWSNSDSYRIILGYSPSSFDEALISENINCPKHRELERERGRERGWQWKWCPVGWSAERERERIPICSLKGSREIKNQFLAPPTYLITISHALRSYKALRRSLSTSLLSSSSSSSSSSHWCVC